MYYVGPNFQTQADVGRNTSQNIGANLAINFSTTELV
jgi:hypothetical protein